MAVAGAALLLHPPVGGAALLAQAPAGAAAQGEQQPPVQEKVVPLRKSDLVRMLSGTTYTKLEVARIVRRNCLGFEATDQDLAHFRSLGADAGVLEALRSCIAAPATAADGEAEAAPDGTEPVAAAVLAGEEEGTTTEPEPAPAAPERPAAAERAEAERAAEEPGPLGFGISPDRAVVPAGDHAVLTVHAQRGEAAAPGVRLVLRGSGEVSEDGTDEAAVTDERGRAVFRFRVLALAGEHELRVTAPGERAGGGARALVVVSPGPPERASVDPHPVPPPISGRDPVRIGVRLADAAGNPVPGRQVQLRGRETGGRPLAAAMTDRSGTAEVVLTGSALSGVERILVFVGGRELASVPVSRRGPGETGTRFVAGGGARGEAGLALPEPLVLQVVDASGAPLAGWPVRLRATNGSVRPEVTETDSAGRARVRVVLGEPGRPTRVTATIGEIERRALFHPTRGGMTPEEFRAGLSEAARRLSAGDLPAAQEQYARLLAADPRHVDALLGHGRALELSGDRAGAEARYRAAVALAPERRDARYRLDGLAEAEERSTGGR